jgi:hypothetical protein
MGVDRIAACAGFAPAGLTACEPAVRHAFPRVNTLFVALIGKMPPW